MKRAIDKSSEEIISKLELGILFIMFIYVNRKLCGAYLVLSEDITYFYKENKFVCQSKISNRVPSQRKMQRKVQCLRYLDHTFTCGTVLDADHLHAEVQELITFTSQFIPHNPTSSHFIPLHPTHHPSHVTSPY